MVRRKEASQCRLNQLGHGSVQPRGLAAQAFHDLVINVECGLHMANHMSDMAIWQGPFLLDSPATAPIYLTFRAEPRHY